MNRTKAILEKFEGPFMQREYLQSITSIIRISRMTKEEQVEVDIGIQYCYDQGWINELNDVYEHFTQICMIERQRPLEYWSWLFKIPLYSI